MNYLATISFSSTRRGNKTPQSEADHQKLCWAWLSHQQFLGDNLQEHSYMVPNGTQLGGSHKQRAMQMSNLKSQGFRTGVSDIVIAYPRPGYHGAYIELKKPAEAYGGPKALRARQTAVRPEQRTWLARMLAVGYWGSIAWGFEDFKLLVDSYMQMKSPPPLDWDERK